MLKKKDSAIIDINCQRTFGTFASSYAQADTSACKRAKSCQRSMEIQ